jgi:hypothetical protein
MSELPLQGADTAYGVAYPLVRGIAVRDREER